MDLPPADRFDSILVVVDQGLLKGMILIPCNKTLTVEDTGWLLWDNLYKRFGLPDKIISDQGPQFASQGFKELLWLLGVKSALSTAYHPQTNRTTEQINQEIEIYLAIYCSSHPKTWTKSLTTLEFTHNNQWHADQSKTPFELMFSDSLISIPTSFEHTKFPTIKEKLKHLQANRQEALAAHEFARQWMINRRKDTFILFKEGDMVWLDTQNIKTNYHSKMEPKHEGPFKIEEVLGPVTYRLKLPITWQIHNVFHAVLLKPYIKNEIYGKNFILPPLEIQNSKEVYEVETILRHRKWGWGYQYLVKWTGYLITEATWELESSLSDDSNLLETYKQHNQL